MAEIKPNETRIIITHLDNQDIKFFNKFKKSMYNRARATHKNNYFKTKIDATIDDKGNLDISLDDLSKLLLSSGMDTASTVDEFKFYSALNDAYNHVKWDDGPNKTKLVIKKFNDGRTNR